MASLRRVSTSPDHRPVRWSVWLVAGVLLGLGLGFVAGLAKPRMRN